MLASPLSPTLPAMRQLRRRWRRELLIVRLKLAAWAARATVDVDIAHDLQLDGRIEIQVWDRTWNRLRIGPGTRIGDGVQFSFRGGTFDVGEGVEMRRLGTYQIGGELTLCDRTGMSLGVVIHCAESVRIGELSIAGEYVTILDSAHPRTAPGVAVHHVAESKPVVIGSNVMLGAHSVVTHGVTIGDQAFVGAAAVVTRDVPAGWLVAGVPAKPIRDLIAEP